MPVRRSAVPAAVVVALTALLMFAAVATRTRYNDYIPVGLSALAACDHVLPRAESGVYLSAACAVHGLKLCALAGRYCLIRSSKRLCSYRFVSPRPVLSAIEINVNVLVTLRRRKRRKVFESVQSLAPDCGIGKCREYICGPKDRACQILPCGGCPRDSSCRGEPEKLSFDVRFICFQYHSFPELQPRA